MSLRGISGNLLTNLLDLSADMEFLLRSTLMSDITLSVEGKYLIYCHKDILRFRSKWFFNVLYDVDSKGVEQIEIDEDILVMEAILCYIYTGNLQLLESLDIPLMEIHEAAEKYGLLQLKAILGKIIRKSGMKEITKFLEFPWEVKVDNCNSLNVECPSVNDFTTYGKDRWKLQIRSLGPSMEDECKIGIYLIRQTEDSDKTVHIVRFSFSVIDCNKEEQLSFHGKYTFIEDGEYLVSKSITLTELTKSCLLSSGMLRLFFTIRFYTKVDFLIPFRLEDSYRRYISSELVQLSDDMYKVLKYGKNHNIHIIRGRLKFHSYILTVRSRLPSEYVTIIAYRAGFGDMAWFSFAAFLYTGQPRYLDDHGRSIYTALCGTIFTMAKQKYSSFLAKNVTLENAFCVLCDALSCEDDSLISVAANFLASKSNIASDPQIWIRIATDKANLLSLYPKCIP